MTQLRGVDGGRKSHREYSFLPPFSPTPKTSLPALLLRPSRSMAFLLAGVTGLMPTQRLPVVSSHAAAVRVASPLMVGAEALAKKEVLVKEIQSGMEDAALMFCVRSEGIPANEMNALRMSIPEDVKIKVCKNNLVKIAASGEGFERFAAIAGELR